MTFPMTVNVAVQVDSMEQFQQILSMVGKPALTTRPIEATVAPKPQIVQEPAVEKTPEKAEPVEQQTELTYGEVSSKVLEVFNQKGRETVVQVLKPFGAETLKTADKKDWPAICKACEEILNA